ncbi:MAG: CNNM domain-containing protein [Thermacetogeniaceae bacterium]
MTKYARERNKWLRHGLVYALVTFFFSLLLSFLTEVFMRHIVVLFLAFLLLFVVILIGIIFDMIGFAAAAAELGSLNAMASNKVFGARQAVRLIKNADQVAVICSDVMGDISSTLAGSLGTVIVFRLLAHKPVSDSSIMTTVVTGLVAALAVGGKALGKGIALKEANQIMFRIGQLLAWVEKLTGYQLFHPSKGERVKKG